MTRHGLIVAVGLALASAACSSSSSGSGDGGAPMDAQRGEGSSGDTGSGVDTGAADTGNDGAPPGCASCCCPSPVMLPDASNTCSIGNQCNLIGCGPCPG